MQLKPFTKLLVALALLMGAWHGQLVAQTYFGGGNPQPIPTSGSGTATCATATTSVATVPIAGTIGTDASLESVTVELTHTFDNDLEISLISPMGTSLDLSSDNGGSGDDYFTTVFMDGAPSILTGSPPFDGTFSPEGGTFAATFDSEPITGPWTLFVCDDLGGDMGTLFTFGITFGPGGSDDCTGYPGDSEGDPVPDNGSSGGFVSEIMVPDAGEIGAGKAIGSVELDLDHTFDGDLEIDLVSPAGTRLSLSDNNGGAGDDYENTTFMDGGDDITVASAPFSGVYQPDGGTFASTFGGESIMGTWRLEIEDIFAGDGGFFGSVTLNICEEEVVCDVPGFQQTDIGCETGAGEYCYDAMTDAWTLASEACFNPAFYRSTDDENFVSRELCGDGEVIAEVTGITGSGYAGIGMREGLSDDSKMLQLMIDGVSLTRRELRQTSPGMAFAHLFQTAGRNWLRLTRSGNVFGAYHSTDGANWQPVIVTQIAMSNCIEVGLLTQNNAPTGTVEAIFENVNIVDAVPLSAPEGLDIAEELPVELEVFPNPATDEVNVTLNSFYGEAVEIQVYNKLGQIITRKVIDEVTFGVETIDVSQFTNGMYLFKVKTDTKEETRRVVVSRK